MSPSRFWRAGVKGGFPALVGPSLGFVAPPSSLYWVHKSLSTISAQAANRRRSASPLLSLLPLCAFALPWATNSAPAGNSVAPTTPRPLRKERRPTALGTLESVGWASGTEDGVREDSVGGKYLCFID